LCAERIEGTDSVRRMVRGRRVAALAVAAVTMSACHASGSPRATAPNPTTTRAPAPGPTTGCGATRANAGAKATIPWAQLRNPILSYAGSGAKDVGVRLANGTWHFFFSSLADDPVHWSIGSATSTDLHNWASSNAPTLWPDQAGTEGLASPDITQEPDGTFVITYQSDPGDVGGSAKLYYRTSRDLVAWTAPKPLARTLHPRNGDRMIDGALAFVGHGVMLGYKYGVADGAQKQAFEIAYSASGSLDGPWTLVGRPSISQYGDTFENYEFLEIDGHWHLVATTNTLDRPYFATLEGAADNPASWLHWIGGRVLDIPAEAWNSAPGPTSVTHEVANAVYLCDARALDGYYYVFYAGSGELTEFGGWGHAKIGIARSTDLVHWQVP
jgi:hypothetical protein